MKQRTTEQEKPPNNLELCTLKIAAFKNNLNDLAKALQCNIYIN